MATGKLKMWNAERGYGFIGDDAGGPDIFLHISALESFNVEALPIDCGQLVSGRQCDDQIAMNHRQPARRYNQTAIGYTREGRDGLLDLGGVAHVDGT